MLRWGSVRREQVLEWRSAHGRDECRRSGRPPVTRDLSLRREALWEYLRGSLWVLPPLSGVMALAAGSVLSAVDIDPSSSPWGRLAFQGTADDARNLLIGI